MLSIHSNLQQAHNHYRRLRNNYDYLQALVNNALTWQSSCVIANNARKQQKLFVQGYNLKVHNVMKYMRKPGLTGWLAGRPAGWLAGWLAGRLAGWLAGWPAGWLAGWLAGRLAGWLAGRLAGWRNTGEFRNFQNWLYVKILNLSLRLTKVQHHYSLTNAFQLVF